MSGTSPTDHVLETGWSFWYDVKPTAEDKKAEKLSAVKVHYKDRIKQIATFHSVEGFWKAYVHMKRPSAIPKDTNVYLFREGCFPAWESYPNGGCWIVKVHKGVGVLGKLWQDLCFGAIGEFFDDLSVVGVSMASRPHWDNLSVWTRDTISTEAKFRIGEKVKHLMGMEENTIIEYKLHRDSLRDKSTFNNTESFVFQASASPKYPARSSPHLPGGLEPLPEAAESKPAKEAKDKSGVLMPESPAFTPSAGPSAAAVDALPAI